MTQWQYVRYMLRVLLGVKLLWWVHKILPKRNDLDMIASLAALAVMDKAIKVGVRHEQAR